MSQKFAVKKEEKKIIAVYYVARNILILSLNSQFESGFFFLQKAQANLAIRPPKCQIPNSSLAYLQFLYHLLVTPSVLFCQRKYMTCT